MGRRRIGSVARGGWVGGAGVRAPRRTAGDPHGAGRGANRLRHAAARGAAPRCRTTSLPGAGSSPSGCAICHDPVGQPLGETPRPATRPADGRRGTRGGGAPAHRGRFAPHAGLPPRAAPAAGRSDRCLPADGARGRGVLHGRAGRGGGNGDFDRGGRGAGGGSGPGRDAVSGRVLGEGPDRAPVGGIAVSVGGAAGRTFTTTVFSDEDGGFVFPALDDGDYRLWAQGSRLRDRAGRGDPGRGEPGRPNVHPDERHRRLHAAALGARSGSTRCPRRRSRTGA